MGVPTWEVGYTSAMPRREDHEVRQGHVGHWIKKILGNMDVINEITYNHHSWSYSYLAVHSQLQLAEKRLMEIAWNSFENNSVILPSHTYF